MVHYKKVYCPNHPAAQKDGRVYEHRLVMEKKLGRYLKDNEEVHHIDHNPRNNNPDNLMLFTNHSEHTRHEMIGNIRNKKDMSDRVCNKCNKSDDELPKRKDTGSADWYSQDSNWLCKNCYQKISIKSLQYQKEYRVKNRDKIVTYLRDYYKRNKKGVV